MNKANIELRDCMKQCGVKQWELAAAFGVSEVTFCRWLRSEMSEAKKLQALSLINEISEGRSNV